MLVSVYIASCVVSLTFYLLSKKDYWSHFYNRLSKIVSTFAMTLGNCQWYRIPNALHQERLGVQPRIYPKIDENSNFEIFSSPELQKNYSKCLNKTDLQFLSNRTHSYPQQLSIKQENASYKFRQSFYEKILSHCKICRVKNRIELKQVENSTTKSKSLDSKKIKSSNLSEMKSFFSRLEKGIGRTVEHLKAFAQIPIAGEYNEGMNCCRKNNIEGVSIRNSKERLTLNGMGEIMKRLKVLTRIAGECEEDMSYYYKNIKESMTSSIERSASTGIGEKVKPLVGECKESMNCCHINNIEEVSIMTSKERVASNGMGEIVKRLKVLTRVPIAGECEKNINCYYKNIKESMSEDSEESESEERSASTVIGETVKPLARECKEGMNCCHINNIEEVSIMTSKERVASNGMGEIVKRLKVLTRVPIAGECEEDMNYYYKNIKESMTSSEERSASTGIGETVKPLQVLTHVPIAGECEEGMNCCQKNNIEGVSIMTSKERLVSNGMGEIVKRLKVLTRVPIAGECEKNINCYYKNIKESITSLEEGSASTGIGEAAKPLQVLTHVPIAGECEEGMDCYHKNIEKSMTSSDERAASNAVGKMKKINTYGNINISEEMMQKMLLTLRNIEKTQNSESKVNIFERDSTINANIPSVKSKALSIIHSNNIIIPQAHQQGVYEASSDASIFHVETNSNNLPADERNKEQNKADEICANNELCLKISDGRVQQLSEKAYSSNERHEFQSLRREYTSSIPNSNKRSKPHQDGGSMSLLQTVRPEYESLLLSYKGISSGIILTPSNLNIHQLSQNSSVNYRLPSFNSLVGQIGTQSTSSGISYFSKRKNFLNSKNSYLGHRMNSKVISTVLSFSKPLKARDF